MVCGGKLTGGISGRRLLVFCDKCDNIKGFHKNSEGYKLYKEYLEQGICQYNKYPGNKLTTEQYIANLKGKRGKRGRKDYYYNYEWLSKTTGLTTGYLRVLNSSKVFSIKDLQSVIRWLVQYYPDYYSEIINGKYKGGSLEDEVRRKEIIAEAKQQAIELDKMEKILEQTYEKQRQQVKSD